MVNLAIELSSDTVFRMSNQGLSPNIVGDAWEVADWLLKKDIRAALADYFPPPSAGTSISHPDFHDFSNGNIFPAGMIT